jgi:uncharacterized protein
MLAFVVGPALAIDCTKAHEPAEVTMTLDLSRASPLAPER